MSFTGSVEELPHHKLPLMHQREPTLAQILSEAGQLYGQGVEQQVTLHQHNKH